MRPYAILIGAQFAVGAAAIFARFALTGASPLAVSALRLSIAAAVLWAFAAISHRRVFIPKPGKGLVVAGIALAAHFATWIWSLEYTSVAISTLLVATTPVWTALYDSIARDRRLSSLAWIAMAAGGTGVYLVAGFNTARPPVPGHEILGGMLAVAGAISIGAYFLVIREIRESLGTRKIVTQTYSWAAIALVAAAAVARQPAPAFYNAGAWGGILAMALISQLLGHTAMNAALRWFSASAVAFTTLIEPVVAAALAFFIFGERLTVAAIAGGVLILAAIGAFLREEQRVSC